MPAPDAPIWVLIQQIVSQLSAITVAGGYRTDLGQTVTGELVQVHAEPDADPPPRIVVALVDQVRLSSTSTLKRRRDFTLACEASVWGDELDSQQRAHEALEDMLWVLPSLREYRQSGSVTSSVKVAAAEIIARPEGLPVTAAVVLLEVAMHEQLPPPIQPTPVPPP